jgi:hypothetical protein
MITISKYLTYVKYIIASYNGFGESGSIWSNTSIITFTYDFIIRLSLKYYVDAYFFITQPI